MTVKKLDKHGQEIEPQPCSLNLEEVHFRAVQVACEQAICVYPIAELGIDILTHEIEKGRELGITDALGVGFVAFGETVQECKDLLWGDLFDGSIAKFMDKPFYDGPVGSNCVFFWNGSCGNQSSLN
jgi:hypothetical protein